MFGKVRLDEFGKAVKGCIFQELILHMTAALTFFKFQKLGQVRLGQIRFGKVMIKKARLGKVKLVWDRKRHILIKMCQGSFEKYVFKQGGGGMC